MFFSFIIPAIIGFAATWLAVRYFMALFGRIGMTAIDQQKANKPWLPTSAGIPMAFGFLLGAMAFVAGNTFITLVPLNLTQLFAAVLAALLIALVGFFDDLNIRVRGQKIAFGTELDRVGLPKWSKPLLVLLAAVPLMAVSAGVSKMALPFIGSVDFGLLYPLLLVPLAVMFVSNASNILAGFNGIHAGPWFVATLTLAGYCLYLGRVEAAALALIGAGAQLGYFYWEWPPSRMLPGDSTTYFNGGLFAAIAIVGNIEKFAAIIFIPWIAEFVLKFIRTRGTFRVRTYGDLAEDGTIKLPYPRIMSVSHIVPALSERLRGKRLREWQISAAMIIIEAAICAAAIGLVWAGAL